MKYLRNTKITLILVLSIILTSCLKEDLQNTPFVSFTPVDTKDDWDIGTPPEVQIDNEQLTEVYKEIQNDADLYWQVRSMLVFRNEKLVAESYFKTEEDRTVARPVWSCTKQVLGILIGIAIDKGLIASVDEPIGTFLADELKNYPEKQNITIRHLLTMTSGISFENYGLSSDDAAILQQKPDNLLAFVLQKSMNYNPGEKFIYKDSDPQILSAIIEKVTGKKTNIWAEEVLFSKLQIRSIDWITYKDGSTIGAFGIITTPRELAKFGQLVLNKGIYQGVRIVSANWIKEMTSNHVDASGRQFGYMWWSYTEKGIHFMSGNGGQFVMVVPEKQLMVVFTAQDKTQGNFRFSTPNARYFTEKIASICH
jgi:CubicO group peptidase (beta-lactamase class C family)